MKNKTVLITGGAGYIGSVLSTTLVRDGYNVIVLDNLTFGVDSLSHLFFYSNFKLVRGDVRDKELVSSQIALADIVIPLAAIVGAPACAKDSNLAFEVNEAAIKLLVNCLRPDHQLIYLNTNTGYSMNGFDRDCDELSPMNPSSVYGITKKNAEEFVLGFSNSVSFRLASVFGCSYRMRHDLLLHFFVNSAVVQRQIEVFEPEFRRNFIHVRDVVATIIFAINNFDLLRNNIFNLGLAGASPSKMDLAKKVSSNISNVKLTVLEDGADPDKRDYLVSSNKIEKLGCPSNISIEDGIKELASYYANSAAANL